ncbi:MAG TPA: hypothetical protein VKV57_14355 [bacterium]|nr:hypothetical protein [bacterium]
MTLQADIRLFKDTRRHPHLVVHLLFDEPEEKMDTVNIPRMHLTRTVKFSLLTLRAYLIVMAGMPIYHFLDLAGILGHRVK